MKPFAVCVILLLLLPGLVAAQAGGPPAEPSAAADAGAGPWLMSQVGPPPQSAGPGPGPGSQPPRPPRGMGPGMGAWWRNSEIVKQLDLSEAQVGQIEQIFVQQRMRLVDLRADLEKQELQLQPLLDVDRPDEAKVVAQLDLITAARAKLEKENALMLLAIRRVLSVEQWKKLQALQQPQMIERGRPGGPPPGGGPQPSGMPPGGGPPR